jgi:hypothetical protein
MAREEEVTSKNKSGDCRFKEKGNVKRRKKGLPGTKKIKKAKFGHKQFRKRLNYQMVKKAKF